MTQSATQSSPDLIGPDQIGSATVMRTLQRQILPADRDIDVLPLYVDPDPAVLDADRYAVGGNRNAVALNSAQLRQAISSGETIHPDQILDRHRLRLAANEELSFGTYFNGFAAGYWRRWTIVDQVRLTVSLEGRGAGVTVYRSMANGRSQRVEGANTGDSAAGEFTFDLTLKPFVDGGWYWYDVVAGEEPVTVDAIWEAEVPAERVDRGTLAISITTMNRPDFCGKLLAQMGSERELLDLLDEVVVAEQGKDKVVDSVEFPGAQQALGDKLRVIEQGNIGGSGGYARGQYEAVKRDSATYLMCMDDDVICEPQSIIRALTFSDLAKRPTIVGGHMFSLYDRAELHSWGEIVDRWKFWWRSPNTVHNSWDFGARNLRSTRWLHRRVDVDFNGWFMCVIPLQALKDVGLSLPLFIKWDDSEFGLRAAEAGYRTVTLPGAAVWHIPWTDKNDALDWQAYFHHRNRLIAALLHSPYEHAGGLIQESFAHSLKHLVSMQYSTVELRNLAIEELFEGPDKLHQELPTKLAAINAFRKQWSDAVIEADRDAFPVARRTKLPKRGKDEWALPTRKSVLLSALLSPLRQLSPVREASRSNPEMEVAGMDAKWYFLNRYDSAVVSMPDGMGAALYQRDPDHFKKLTRQNIELHRRLYREWPRLAREYRDSLARITSPEEWEKTFRASQEDTK